MKRATLSIVATLCLAGLAGCAPAARVDLQTVFDTEAADILTNQHDVTDTACEAVAGCVQTLGTYQALILKFDSAASAESAAHEKDDLAGEVFVVRWSVDPITWDRSFVLLDTAHSSTRDQSRVS